MTSRPKHFLVLLLIATLLSACSSLALSAGPSTVVDVQIDSNPQIEIISIPFNATPTATPFRPLQPTAVYEPTRKPTVTPLPSPTPKPTEGPQEPVFIGGYYQRPKDQINILLLGSDQRVGDPSFRTDTIILATINPGLQTVSLTSFPRDLYIPIPGWTNNRINTVFNLGGFQLMQQTFAYNFGIKPDHYIMVNFSAFTRIIDSLEGVEVNVAQKLTDHRDQKGRFTVKSGINLMDGETALWYVRSRYTSSDFDRTRRQQEVIRALFDRLISLDTVTKIPEMYDIYQDTVMTDLRLKDITPLLPLGLKIRDTDRIQNYYIGQGQVFRYIVPMSGADVLLPNQYAVMDVIYQAAGIP